MKKNLGGRPRHHGEEVKKAAIAVRTSPSIQAALREAADQNGRSITQEVEARLIVSFERDAGQRSTETELLLNRLAAEIAQLERFTGKRWHKDRATAEALKALLSSDAPAWIIVDDPLDDELVAQPLDEMLTLIDQQDELADQLRNLGVQVQPRHAIKTLLKDDDGPSAFRVAERLQIGFLDLSHEAQTTASALIDQMEVIDQKIQTSRQRFSQNNEPYRDAAERGRQLYSTWRNLPA